MFTYFSFGSWFFLVYLVFSLLSIPYITWFTTLYIHSFSIYLATGQRVNGEFVGGSSVWGESSDQP